MNFCMVKVFQQSNTWNNDPDLSYDCNHYVTVSACVTTLGTGRQLYAPITVVPPMDLNMAQAQSLPSNQDYTQSVHVQ